MLFTSVWLPIPTWKTSAHAARNSCARSEAATASQRKNATTLASDARWLRTIKRLVKVTARKLRSIAQICRLDQAGLTPGALRQLFREANCSDHARRIRQAAARDVVSCPVVG